MKISVCMPVMGRGRMLAQAVYSILAQGYRDVELVIQDGAPDVPARDNTDAGTALACLGNRLSYEAGRDGGIFPALNMCLKRATGGILYFMCSDDLLCPGALAAVNAAFTAERFGGPFWVYGKTMSADAVGRTLGIDGRQFTYAEMLAHNRLGSPAVFWSRQAMDLAGMFNPRYRWAADYDMWLRLWRRYEPMFIDQTLGVFRHHDDNASQVNSAQLEEEATRIGTRHAALGDVIARARNRFASAQAYGGNPTAEKE